MKTLNRYVLALTGALMISGSVLAQPGPGGGPGRGPGAGWRMNPGNTPGMALMTPEERNAHRDKMRSLQSYDECVAYVAEHHAQMVTRAQEKGITLPAPRSSCEVRKNRGQLK